MRKATKFTHFIFESTTQTHYSVFVSSMWTVDGLRGNVAKWSACKPKVDLTLKNLDLKTTFQAKMQRYIGPAT